MKRDMELIRKMVLAIEDEPSGFAPHFNFDAFTSEHIGSHAHLMNQAGLATGSNVTHTGSIGPEAVLTALTWTGHEFAAAARNESIWKQAMKSLKDKGMTVTISVLVQLLSKLAAGALGTGSK
jgi:hypothetical protein